MFEIDTGLIVDSWKVAAVKRVGEGKSAVFLDGQSPVDGGFLVEGDYIKIATDVLEARAEDDEEPEEEDGNQESSEDEDEAQ
jgi:hypothetical protein